MIYYLLVLSGIHYYLLLLEYCPVVDEQRARVEAPVGPGIGCTASLVALFFRAPATTRPQSMLTRGLGATAFRIQQTLALAAPYPETASQCLTRVVQRLPPLRD